MSRQKEELLGDLPAEQQMMLSFYKISSWVPALPGELHGAAWDAQARPVNVDSRATAGEGEGYFLKCAFGALSMLSRVLCLQSS